MCLLAIGWQADRGHPLVFAGNRDEFHARPTAEAAWWEDAPHVIGGRDLQGGGTWLAAHRRGRFAVVTNFREPAVDPASTAPSRGALVADFLNGSATARDYALDLERAAGKYAGFNLLVADSGGLHYVSNRSAGRLDLPSGVYALSNSALDTPWPKVARLRESMHTLVGSGTVSEDDMLELLSDRRVAPDAELPDTGIGREFERLLSAAFIVSPAYGTRCSSVFLLNRDGRASFVERRFGPDGCVTGETREQWRTGTHAE